MLDIFAKTRSAFCPVTTDNNKVVAVVFSLDILKVVEKLELSVTVGSLSSQLIYIRRDDSIGNALQVMLEKGIRSLVIKQSNDEDKTRRTKTKMIINDRNILEFLLSHDSRDTINDAIELLKSRQNYR